MLNEGMRFATSLAVTTTGFVLESVRALGGDDVIEIQPRQFRSLLLSFEDSIQRRIPEILGEDEAERIDTLARLLRGTSEEDLTKLISALQQALARLDAEKRRPDRAAPSSAGPERERPRSQRRSTRGHR